MQKYAIALKGDTYTIYSDASKIPDPFSEQILLLTNSPKFGDLNGTVANIVPGQTYVKVPTGEYEQETFSGGLFTTSSMAKTKFAIYRPAYINPSPMGLSLGDHPNGADNPLMENNMRIFFYEEMSLHDRYWLWLNRGNSITTNVKWFPGKNCLF